MRWRVTHTIDAPRALVERRLLSSERIELAPRALRTVREAKLLRSERVGRAVRYEARFAVRDAVLPPALRRFAGAVAWVERVTWSLATHAGTFAVEPELPAALRRRVRCQGSYTLRALDAQRTERELAIELTIAVPFASVRDAAEGAVRVLLATHFDDEADFLAHDAPYEREA